MHLYCLTGDLVVRAWRNTFYSYFAGRSLELGEMRALVDSLAIHSTGYYKDPTRKQAN